MEAAMRYYKKKTADYSDVYEPEEGAQTVAIEASVSHLEFRSLERIYQLARAMDHRVTRHRIKGHGDFQVTERQLWEMEDRAS
jgi:hypothetical protein